MSRYGESFLTKPRRYTYDEAYAERSRMMWSQHSHLKEMYTLSLLGVINGCPLLGRFLRLACRVEEDGTISGWLLIRA